MNIQFSNEIIRDLNLPHIEPKNFVPIEAKYKRYLLFRNGFWIFILLTISISIYFIPKIELNPVYLWIVSTSILFFLGISLVNIILNFPKKKYLIRQRDISYQKGYFFRKTITIPHNRIQHVEILQTPFLRIFGLSKVMIYTAGGSSSDLSIPGLLPKKAEEIKQYLSHKISKDAPLKPTNTNTEND